MYKILSAIIIVITIFSSNNVHACELTEYGYHSKTIVEPETWRELNPITAAILKSQIKNRDVVAFKKHMQRYQAQYEKTDEEVPQPFLFPPYKMIRRTFTQESDDILAHNVFKAANKQELNPKNIVDTENDTSRRPFAYAQKLDACTKWEYRITAKNKTEIATITNIEDKYIDFVNTIIAEVEDEQKIK